MSVLGVFTAGKGNPYIHLQWGVDERAQATLPDVYSVYRNQKAKFKNTISRQFNFNEGKYKNVFDLMDEIAKGFDSSDILSKAYQGIHTSGEKVNLFTADGNVVTRSFEQLRYFKGNDLLFTQIDGELKNLQQYINAIEKILKDSQICFNSQMISEVVEEILTQQAIANRLGEKLSTKTMNEVMIDALDKHQGKFLQAKTDNKLANYERFAAQLEVYKQLISQLGGQISTGSNKNLIQNIAYNIGITISRLGGFLYEPTVAEAIKLAEKGVFKTIEAIAGTSAEKVKVTGPEPRIENLKTKKVVRTEDIQFSFLSTENAVDANVSVQLPGASIKAITYKPTDKMQEVHIQTGTTLGDVIIRANLTIKQRYLVANSLIHDGANSKSGRNTRAFIAAKNILNALSGTLNKSDSSYFLIVNNKAFTVPAILEECSKQNGLINVKASLEGINDIKGLNDKYEAVGVSPSEAAIQRSINTWNALKNVYMNTSLLINNQMFL